MPLPKRNNKRITLLPFEEAFSNGSPAAAFENMIDRRAGMPMYFGYLIWPKQLNLARHCCISVPASGRIDIAQQSAVMRILIVFAHQFERFVCILPCITEGNTA